MRPPRQTPDDTPGGTPIATFAASHPPPMEPTVTPDFTAHARRVLAAFADVGCPQAPSREAVAWLDAALDRTPPDTDARDLDADGIGAVLGEAIAHQSGGAWHHHTVQQAWGVRLPSGETAFPLQRAHRHAAGHADASILAFYDTVAGMR